MNGKFPGEIRDASRNSMDLLDLPQSEMSQSDNSLLLYAQGVKGSCVFQKDDSYQLALIFLQQGHFFLEQKGNQREVPSQSVFFLDPSEDFCLNFVEDSNFYLLLISSSVWSSHMVYRPSQLLGVRISLQNNLGKTSLDTLRAVRRMLKKAHPLELESMCIGFLYILMPLIAQFRRQAKGLDGTLTKHEILRQKVESYLKENLNNKELTATEVASVFSISSRQLNNIYSPSGTTVMARLKELRLSEAARKLREHRYQKRSVREISELCGFGSFENFCRSFKSHFGVSATEWKAKRLPNVLNAVPEISTLES